MEKQNRDLLFLDGLRGLAALYVMIGHARWLLWEGYSEGFLTHPQDYSILEKALVYLLSFFKFGHEAVIFFFVLSGFVIHLRYSMHLSDPKGKAKFEWVNYTLRRARRLYPPLLLAMGTTLFFDVLGSKCGFPIYQHNTPYLLINQDILVHHDWVTGLGNLLFLMNTYVPVWGTNGPLWSLKFEWWFYMLYPVFWWICSRSIPLATGIMCSLWVLSLFNRLGAFALLNEVFSMMLVWWVGALIADVFTRRITIPFKLLCPLIGLAIVVPFMKSNSVIRDLIWGLAFCGLIANCFALQQKGKKLKFLRSIKPLGDLSYSLYVLHFPIFVFMSGWIMMDSPEHRLPEHFGWVFAGIIITLAFAYLAHLFVEAPFITRKVSPLLLTYEAKT